MMIFRHAREDDLAHVYEVFYLNEIAGLSDPPVPGEIPADLRHILRTGTMYVAEKDGELLAFGAAISRGRITFLTDLFVRPTSQSAQLGRILLSHVLPQDGHIHCTMSSTDHRALALYIRAGMQPLWPNFNLRLPQPLKDDLAASDIELVEGEPGDPELVRWDEQVSGRARAEDHRYWVEQQRAMPLWFRRRDQVLGYGYVRLNAGTLLDPEACMIGPLGVKLPQDATGCILAAVRWASQHSKSIYIDVPGPHPALAELLTRGFQITYVETYLSTSKTPFFDPECSIASGSNLF